MLMKPWKQELSPCWTHAQDAKRDMRSALSRTALLGELRVKKVIDLVPDPVRRIHGLLEADFNPLQLCKWVPHRQRSSLLHQRAACTWLLGSSLCGMPLACICASVTNL